MPVKSKAQQRFMGAIMSGEIHKKGLSPEKAHEFLHKSKGHIKGLPEHVDGKLARERKKKK